MTDQLVSELNEWIKVASAEAIRATECGQEVARLRGLLARLERGGELVPMLRFTQAVQMVESRALQIAIERQSEVLDLCDLEAAIAEYRADFGQGDA